MTDNTRFSPAAKAIAETGDHQAAVIQGLIEASQYLAERPDVITPYHRPSASTRWCSTREEFVAAAASLPGAELTQRGRDVYAEVTFGPVRVMATVSVEALAGPPVVPTVDLSALAAEIAAARSVPADAGTGEARRRTGGPPPLTPGGYYGMNTTIQHRVANDRLDQIRTHLEKAGIAGCSCDSSTRETAMHLRRAVGDLLSLVQDLLNPAGAQ